MRHTLPGERVVARVTEGRVGDSFVRADAVEVLEAAPGRVEAPCPYAAPGLLRWLRLPARLPRHAAGAQGRRRARAVRARRRARRRRRRPAGARATRTACAGAPASSSPSTQSGRAGLRGHRSRDDRARRRLPHRDAAGSSTPGCSTPSGPTSSRSTSSTPRTRTSRCSCPLPAPEGSDGAAAARRRARPRRGLGGRVRRRRPGLLAGAPGCGLDVPVPRGRAARGASRATGSSTSTPGRASSRCASASSSPPTASSSASRATRRAVENGAANTEHLDNVEWRANRVDRELRSLVVAGRDGRPRGARPAPHGCRQGRHGAAGAAGAATGRLRRVRPRGPGPRRQGRRDARLRPGLARGLGRLPDDPPRRVHRRARARGREGDDRTEPVGASGAAAAGSMRPGAPVRRRQSPVAGRCGRATARQIGVKVGARGTVGGSY